MNDKIDAVVTGIVRNVAELPDRTSPDDWPEAMLVTGDELSIIIRTALEQLAQPQGEARDSANLDAINYGSGFLMLYPDGTEKRIDPASIILKTDATPPATASQAEHEALKARVRELEGLLQDFVDVYRQMPDGPMGKGLTNGHFLRAEKALSTNPANEVRQ